MHDDPNPFNPAVVFELAQFRKHLSYVVRKYYKKVGDNDIVNVTFLSFAAECMRAYTDPATRARLISEFLGVVNRREDETPSQEAS